MPIQKLTAKYSTSALLMDKEDLPNILSFAPMELYSTKTTLSAIGGSISIVLRLKIYILLMTILPLNVMLTIQMPLLLPIPVMVLPPATIMITLLLLITLLLIMRQKLRLLNQHMQKKYLLKHLQPAAMEHQKRKLHWTIMMLSVRPVDSEAHNVKDVTSVVTVTAEVEGKIIADVPANDEDVKEDDSEDKNSPLLPFSWAFD